MSFLIESSEKVILWIILTSPLVISMALYFWIRFIMSKRSYEDEEMIYTTIDAPILTTTTTTTTLPPSQCNNNNSNNNINDPSSPPPSYIASHKDRIYILPNRELEKPPMYPYPPSYDYATGPEDVPLSEIQLRIIEKRQRLLHQQRPTLSSS
ncbi:unnamed protein product [Cunninghamella blakesleeana]